MNLLLIIISLLQPDSSLNKYQIKGFAQGTTYSITYYSTDSCFTKSTADSIFIDLDRSLSLYQQNSLITQFNNSRRKIKLDEHLHTVIDKSLEIYKQSFQLFDITIKPLVDAWGFGKNGHRNPPSERMISKLLECTGSDKLKVHNGYLIKQKPCVQIDLNGIAQGYSVDVVAKHLRSLSLKYFIIEIGGEIFTESSHPDGSPMKVNIEIPSSDVQEIPEFIQINLPPGAITTSGSYRKYYLNENKMVTHIVNPKTGQASAGSMISVTVFAADAITADGFDNVLMLMYVPEAIKFIENRKDLSALLVYTDEIGQIRKYASPNFPMSDYINSL